MTTAVLFTGIVCRGTFDRLLEQTKDIPHKFASVWENENPEYVKRLSENNFTIVTSEVKLQQFYLPQFIPVVNGLQRIKDDGFQYVLKTRFDVISPDFMKYIELVQQVFKTKITVLSGIETDKRFFVQILEYGNIDDMRCFYTNQPREDISKRFPELFLMETYSKKHNLTKDDIKEIFNFSLPLCIEHNIEFIWYRPNHWITPTRTIPDMRIVGEYCRESMMWIN